MTPFLTSFSWRFGGPLSGLPAAVAWTLLALVGALGAAAILVNYRRTLVSLNPAARHTLTALRLLLWLGLLAALAGPTRVERTYAQKQTRPLAVLLDQSASMTTPDNRRQRRTDDALRQWRALAPAATATHGPPRTFAFADTSAPVALTSLEASNPGTLPAGQTRLFASLDHLLAHAPAGGWGGIVTLTDGIDTTSADHAAALSATTSAALSASTPLYFVSGRNRYAGGSFVSLRDLTLPNQVPKRSAFRLEVLLDSYQTETRVVPVQLRVGGVWREPEKVTLAAGRHLGPYATEITASESGLLPIELRVGEPPDATSLRAEVRVVPHLSTRILYHQGALDWGYRYLADILRRDPAFVVTPIFNIAPPGTRTSERSIATSSPSFLPDNVAGYSAYDVVILANPRAHLFSPAQQAALSAWVSSGGVVLFLAPDNDNIHSFAGSELEKMLPVVFAPKDALPDFDPAVADFRAQMLDSGGSNGRLERDFAQNAARATRITPLSTFVWEPRALTLLGPELASSAPRFANYARIHRAKPGADVLARHATDSAPASGERAILLALQRYGSGQSALLASDALWRWKLNQPSTERGAEIFWQNLLAWLGRDSRPGPRFERAPLSAELNHELTLRLSGAAAGYSITASHDPVTQTAGPPGPPPRLILASGAESNLRHYRWTPPAEGRWMLTARGPDPEAPPLRHWLTITARSLGETSGLPPDLVRLRSLAERTGGAVLSDNPPPAWSATAGSAALALARETLTPLWHQAWVFFILLALYGSELALRRRWNLL